jgi:tRNA pseudouridine55 synthase
VLAEDIGRSLGCGAHLAQLRRLAIGPFSVADAVTVDALGLLEAAARDARLLALDALVGHLPAITLGAAAAGRFAQGAATESPGRAAGRTRVYGPDGTFLGLGVAGADGRLQPRRLLRTGDAAAGDVAAPKTL